MAKTPEQMAQAMIDNMPEKTGKALPAWLDIVRSSGLAKHGEIVRLLKAEHGMTHGFANLVAHQFIHGPAPADGNDLLDNQYSGPKADLRPIYEAVISAVSSLTSGWFVARSFCHRASSEPHRSDSPMSPARVAAFMASAVS